MWTGFRTDTVAQTSLIDVYQEQAGGPQMIYIYTYGSNNSKENI